MHLLSLLVLLMVLVYSHQKFKNFTMKVFQNTNKRVLLDNPLENITIHNPFALNINITLPKLYIDEHQIIMLFQ